MGTKAPNPAVPAHRVSLEAVHLAEELGEKDKTVLFLEWMPVADYESALLESDIGVTFQPDHIESHFSIRARIISYFWAHLPVLLSEGDVTAEWVTAHHLGRVVPAGDVDAIAEALISMLKIPRQSWKARFKRVSRKFTWQTVLKPIITYCEAAQFAPDRLDRRRIQMDTVYSYRSTPAIKKAWQILKDDGLRAMLARTVYHIKWMLSRE